MAPIYILSVICGDNKPTTHTYITLHNLHRHMQSPARVTGGNSESTLSCGGEALTINKGNLLHSAVSSPQHFTLYSLVDLFNRTLSIMAMTDDNGTDNHRKKSSVDMKQEVCREYNLCNIFDNLNGKII